MSADLNEGDAKGNTALIYATEKGNFQNSMLAQKRSNRLICVSNKVT